MTYHKSDLRIVGPFVPKYSKGSTYGLACKTSSCHSFQFSQRDDRSYGQNGTKVLYSEAPIYALSNRSVK